MGVTDLTDSLPWWATQGAGPGGVMPGGGVLNYPAASGGGPNMGYPAQGGPGPTGGPGATPQGGGMDIMAYLQQMFGISPAQAREAQQGGLFPPEAIAAANRGGTPPIMGPKLGQSIFGAGDIDASVVPPMPNPGPPRPYDPFSGGSANTGRPPGYGPPPQPAYSPLASGSANTGQPPAAQQFMPWRGPLAGDSPANTAAAGGAGPGGAAGSNATSNPRFVNIDRPNMAAEGGGQSRGGPPKMSALDLSSLFNRGQQGPNPNAPAPNAQNVSAMRPTPGPLAAQPNLANAPMPPVMPGDIRNQRVRNAIRTPNWFQNL